MSDASPKVVSIPASDALPTPSLDLEAIRRFGPFLNYSRDVRVDTDVSDSKLPCPKRP